MAGALMRSGWVRASTPAAKPPADIGLPVVQRAPRSRRAWLHEAEGHQQEIIDRLRALGADHIADRLGRCQRVRTSRRGASASTWPWRCRSAGCWSCRRTQITAEWRSLCNGGLVPTPAQTVMTVPLYAAGAGLRNAVLHLRRSLRDYRDREARRDRRWRSVAFAGLADSERAYLLCWHPRIAPGEIEVVLGQRWPSIRGIPAEIGDFGGTDGRLSDDDAVTLALLGRGIEPLRVRVMAMGRGSSGRRPSASQERWAAPLPILIG